MDIMTRENKENWAKNQPKKWKYMGFAAAGNPKGTQKMYYRSV